MGNPVLQSKGFLAVPLMKHCRVSSTSVPPSLFFVSIIWEGDMPGHVIVLPSCRKSCFPVGTKLHRSKHEHVLTGLSFLHLPYLFNLPLCVSSICFSFLFFSLRKGKTCHNLTGYVITVKFMLFCNLETSYSMAHLIKHLKQASLVPGFLGVWIVEGAVWLA